MSYFCLLTIYLCLTSCLPFRKLLLHSRRTNNEFICISKYMCFLIQSCFWWSTSAAWRVIMKRMGISGSPYCIKGACCTGSYIKGVRGPPPLFTLHLDPIILYLTGPYYLMWNSLAVYSSLLHCLLSKDVHISIFTVSLSVDLHISIFTVSLYVIVFHCGT